MKFWSLAILAGTVAYGVITEGADARSISVRTSPNEVPQMAVYGATEAPIGHIKFCYHHSDDCRAGFDDSPEMLLTTRRWTELQTINREVNREIKPLSDQAQYGMIENWTFPVSGRGDCEDYVVLKRHKLMELGWPSGALLITVVRDESGEGHAVLTARTHRGDLILDNKHSDILAWSNTPYTYIKRQSATDPRHWDSLVPMHEGPTIAASGTDARK